MSAARQGGLPNTSGLDYRMMSSDNTSRPSGATRDKSQCDAVPVTRRAAVAGAIASTAALAASAASRAHEDPSERVERLAHELSEALGQYLDGQFRALVSAGDDVTLQNVNAATTEPNGLSPEAQVRHYARKLAEALAAPQYAAGGWLTIRTGDAGQPFMLIHDFTGELSPGGASLRVNGEVIGHV